MKQRKHQFHCQFCGLPCDIYKRGKSHRVLVCPKCGVLATNPGTLGKVLKRTGKAVLGEIPGASLVMEGLGLAKDLTSKDSKNTPPARPTHDRAFYSYKEHQLTEALK